MVILNSFFVKLEKGYNMKDIKVLGKDICARCTDLKSEIIKMIEDKKLDVNVEKIVDPEEVTKYGVPVPAVIIDGKVKCSGRLPTNSELKMWIK